MMAASLANDPKRLHFRLLTWNIDGLDERHTVGRAQAVCCFIKAKLPHAVFLQEVVGPTWTEIVSTLSETYDCYSPDETVGYFVAILVHRASVRTTGGLERLDFSSSTMGRQLLQLPVRFAGTDILLMTSHLESTKKAHCSEVRKRQLQMVFDVMKERCAHASCLFAGDLNLRDSELSSVGGLPPGAVDAWEACGSPADQKYTWDMKENDNLDWQFPARPSHRFDRVYLLPERSQGAGLRIPPSPSGTEEDQRFALVGKVRLSKCGRRFPSDHWGIWAEFEVLCPST